jgi:hypothetical protein
VRFQWLRLVVELGKQDKRGKEEEGNRDRRRAKRKGVTGIVKKRISHRREGKGGSQEGMKAAGVFLDAPERRSEMNAGVFPPFP